MNAIRSLPLINRPSRTVTPTATVQATGPAAVQPLGPPPVPEPRAHHTPHPSSNTAIPTPTVAPRSQSMGPITRKASPPSSRSATPRIGGTATPHSSGMDGPQAGAHVDAIGLRFNDAVNRALTGVDSKTKKGFRKGAGWTVGESVAHELGNTAPTDTYLLRAILRNAVRALSIYASRLDALLLPAFSDPQFSAPLNLIPTHNHASPLNSTQAYAVSVAHAAWETCERIEQMLDLGQYPRFLEDGLRPTLDKFDTVVGKVVRPIFLQLKVDLEASVSNTGGGAPKTSAGSMTVPAAVNGAPLTREKSNTGLPRLARESSGGGYSRALAVPANLQQFASRVDGARKVFETVAAPCGHDGEGWIVKVMVAVVWRGMRVIMEADHTPNRSPSPGTVHKALSGLGKEATPTVAQSPSLAKITSLSILTPRGAGSRPPSPPRTASQFDPATHSLMSFEGLVKRLVNGLVQPPTAPPSSADTDDQEQEHIAREALHEALEALESATIATAASHGDNASARILASVRRLRDDIDDDADEKLDDALEDLPSVQLFNLIQRRANVALAALPTNPPLRLREVTEIWGWTQAEYERQILSGFGPAEENGPLVADAHKPEIESMLGSLATLPVDDNASKIAVMTATEWVRALGVALEARCDVKVARA
ncbi:uncharacterized protein CcaverHIS019_0305070 [Cutaneotrichosporon cavernicola]|uniref:Uncharacterized protein n=1 Tax=Cutaneotrichosporon cavernicola TaxID=279322 RepID=A0AA48ICN7_9TREE|nr:uncharacterized protein CcaverHIS019_0305070 [Cutaneotrichosporon cavernicola]BEI90437.1 hypothetical protein CcaverHIS019_0305070 [Cutaneotrichosporon cavernicola]BEI98212.1 hypothetical protein CcaverHIS631_0305110 [Cutaneotrichosporon cavernicola]BEJ05988.1 hypothetical protein CcaverHIS641_0305100 [Cutaneotrichosporon cavernicola]